MSAPQQIGAGWVREMGVTRSPSVERTVPNLYIQHQHQHQPLPGYKQLLFCLPEENVSPSSILGKLVSFVSFLGAKFPINYLLVFMLGTDSCQPSGGMR